jgi:hypothetical protein
MNEILFGAQAPFCRPDRGVPEEQLDLLKLRTGSAAHLATTVMRQDAGHPGALPPPK